jgi:putative transposase
MWVTSRDLTSIDKLPSTTQGINRRAKVEGWISRQRKGQIGNVVEYNIESLPLSIQNELKERFFISQMNGVNSSQVKVKPLSTKVNAGKALGIMRQCPAVLENKLNDLTEKQRIVADARMMIVTQVLKLEQHLSRNKAIQFIVDRSKTGELPEELQQAIITANARKTEGRTISHRVLYAWLLNYLKAENAAERLALLSPGHNKSVAPERISWLPLFLSHYRNTNGIGINGAYEEFTKDWQQQYADQPAMLAAMPKYDAVRRALKKLPPSVRNHGRLTGSALRATKIYVKRDWSQLTVNDFWVGDGHNMKMKVAHPIHGSPFSPEITLVLDTASRYLVGWSLSLSENTIAVADAIRYGIERHGRPLGYYSDNGAGETNKMLDAPLTGILPRLGIHHETGIPGNPQGRGIIERLNKVIPVKIARKFQTFYGAGADKETTRKMLVGINSASNALAQGKELNARQQADIKKLPSWNQLLDAIEEVVDWYNNQHEHSSLPQKPNGKHYTPAEYRRYLIERDNVELSFLSDIELRDAFLPQITRTVKRGWISAFNYDYSALELADYDGQEVIVGYDIHNASRVTVRKMDGTFICFAILNGNTRDAFPKPFIEKLKEQRVKGMRKRAEQKIALAEAELRPVLNAGNSNDFDGLIIDGEAIAVEVSNNHEQDEPFFMYEFEREEYYRKKQA